MTSGSTSIEDNSKISPWEVAKRASKEIESWDEERLSDGTYWLATVEYDSIKVKIKPAQTCTFSDVKGCVRLGIFIMWNDTKQVG